MLRLAQAMDGYAARAIVTERRHVSSDDCKTDEKIREEKMISNRIQVGVIVSSQNTECVLTIRSNAD